LTINGVDEHYLQLIRSGYIDGIIALDNVPFASVLEPIHKKGIPVVNMGYHATRYYVRSDDYTGGYQLLEHLVELGHSQIGIIDVQPKLNFSTDQRVSGIRAAAEALGVNFATLPIARGDFSVASGEKCAAELLSLHPEVTALICLNDRMALGAIQQARRMGRRVPQTLSVVGFDDIPMAAASDPSLTTIRSDAPRMGREATRILFDVLNGQTPDPVICPVQLMKRQSSAACERRLRDIG
jgi:DNA-binding LacI/PurR family transcriptional regulator